MGWPGDVLPVFQQPLCSFPVLAVAQWENFGDVQVLVHVLKHPHRVLQPDL